MLTSSCDRGVEDVVGDALLVGVGDDDLDRVELKAGRVSGSSPDGGA